MKCSIDHIEIYVSNLENSRKFWSWLLEKLGYKLFQEWEKGFSYILDETYIVFVQTEEKFLDVPYHRKRTGLNHLAFRCGTRDFVSTLTKELQNRNVNILYKDIHPFAGGKDHFAVYFEDPDRIKVEIIAAE